MKKLTLIIITSGFMFTCTNNGTGKHDNDHKLDSTQITVASKDTSKKSIPSETRKWIGNADIKINYNLPFGEPSMLPYGKSSILPPARELQ